MARPPVADNDGFELTMIDGKNRLKLAISPIGLAVVSFFIMVSAYLVPKDLYQAALLENYLVPDYPYMAVFYSLCILSFVLGVITVTHFMKSLSTDPGRKEYNFEHVMYFMGGLILLNLFSVFSMIREHDALAALDSSMGQELKYAANKGGLTSYLSAILVCCTYWCFYIYLRYREEIGSETLRQIICFEVISSILLVVLTYTVRLSRSQLLPFLIGIAVIYAADKSKKHNPSLATIAALAGGVLLTILAVFVLFAYFRGSTNLFLLANAIMGYGPASFSHLCAELQGRLHNPYEGEGGFTFLFLSHIPMLSNIFSIDSVLKIPTMAETWPTEFVFTSAADLNPSYIWVTAFGYYYFDFGNFVYIYVFGTGLLIGYGWVSFQRGQVFGVLAYPFFAGTIVLWSTCYLLVLYIRPVIISAALLWFLEIVFMQRRNVLRVRLKTHG